MSIASKDGRPSLGEINGVPMQGPLGPPPPQDMDIDSSRSDHNKIEDAAGDNASDTTLVEPPSCDDNDYMVVSMEEKEQQQDILDDKENLKPLNIGLPDHSRSHSTPLGPTSPSRLNEQEKQRSSAKDIPSSKPDSSLTDGLPHTPETMSPPERAPPIPPRPQTVEQTRRARDEVELGAQQDVTEVIANVLFQMQCAIKANRFDVDGEQLDEIKKYALKFLLPSCFADTFIQACSTGRPRAISRKTAMSAPKRNSFLTSKWMLPPAHATYMPLLMALLMCKTSM